MSIPVTTVVTSKREVILFNSFWEYNSAVGVLKILDDQIQSISTIQVDRKEYTELVERIELFEDTYKIIVRK